MGISDFGEMTRLTAIACPDVCVITNIGWCHLENLKTRDGILKAKTEIFKSMNPDGTVILNGDDDKLITIKDVYIISCINITYSCHHSFKPVIYNIFSIYSTFIFNSENTGFYYKHPNCN